MRSNSEFVAQAIAAIPLWRAFLDTGFVVQRKKEAEQDALLAEVLAEKPKPTLLSSLTTRFSRRTTAKGENQPATDEPIPIPITELGQHQSPDTFSPPIIEEAVTHEDEKMPSFSLDDHSPLSITAPDEIQTRKKDKEALHADDHSPRAPISIEKEQQKEAVSPNDDNDLSMNKQDLSEANQFQDLFN